MKTLSKEKLKNMLEKEEDFFLVNVLDKEYFDKGHIPTSINIPINNPEFIKHVKTYIPDKNAKVVVYCASFECLASPGAAKKMKEAGYKKVYDYEGGIKDWTDAGFPVHSH